jgi:hypothetical protein
LPHVPGSQGGAAALVGGVAGGVDVEVLDEEPDDFEDDVLVDRFEALVASEPSSQAASASTTTTKIASAASRDWERGCAAMGPACRTRDRQPGTAG